MQYWLVKSEPGTYSFADLVRDKKTDWTGVRNYAARLHLRAMRVRDEVLFYHSGDDKAVVGLAQVRRAAFPDPTAPVGEDWAAVELAPTRPFPSQVSLAQIKADAALAQIELIRQSRLSVMPIRPQEFVRILELAGTSTR